MSQQQFQARVTVMPRRAVLDPQGRAIRDALARVGFDQIGDVRAGKSFSLSVTAADRAAAESAVGAMCEKLLANPVMEDFSVEILESDP